MLSPKWEICITAFLPKAQGSLQERDTVFSGYNRAVTHGKSVAVALGMQAKTKEMSFGIRSHHERQVYVCRCVVPMS